MPCRRSAAFLLLFATIARADDLDALPKEPPPAKRLDAYLQARAKVHFDARRHEVEGLKTGEDIAKRQAKLKEAFRAGVGELPAEKTPLNAKVVGRDRRDGYSVERVVYESRPGFHVTANFYLPDGPPPFPGVLVPCGHAEEGKAYEQYQRMSILLAKNGIAALCFDPIGQGERKQWVDDAGKPKIPGSTNEHTILGIGSLLVGRTVAGYRLWDAVRSLDYLAGRPEVDPKRLGCTGNSGGGTETAYLMAFDDRVAVAAPSCYITSLERLFATIGPQDGEQNLVGQVARGLEHADFVTLRAPKPTLICGGTRDFFDIRGTWDTFREAKRIYCTLGLGERVDIFESDEPHGLTKVRREACLRWLRRWLLGKDDAAVEGEIATVPAKDLRCTETGQVLTSLKGKSAFDLNAARARELEKGRAAKTAGRSPEALRREVRARLAMPESAGEVVVRPPSQIGRDGYEITKWTFETEPGVLVPVLLFRAKPETDRRLVVYVGADRSLAAPGGEIERRVKAGEDVALVDPRGMGEARPDTKAGPLEPDWREAFLALGLDRPLLGQRVFDVLQAIRGLKHPVHLVGVGQGGPIALHAALLDPGVESVTIERSAPSWASIVTEKSAHGDVSLALPGVLSAYDWPDLVAAIGPGKVTIRGAGKAAEGR